MRYNRAIKNFNENTRLTKLIAWQLQYIMMMLTTPIHLSQCSQNFTNLSMKNRSHWLGKFWRNSVTSCVLAVRPRCRSKDLGAVGLDKTHAAFVLGRCCCVAHTSPTDCECFTIGGNVCNIHRVINTSGWWRILARGNGRSTNRNQTLPYLRHFQTPP